MAIPKRQGKCWAVLRVISTIRTRSEQRCRQVRSDSSLIYRIATNQWPIVFQRGDVMLKFFSVHHLQFFVVLLDAAIRVLKEEYGAGVPLHMNHQTETGLDDQREAFNGNGKKDKLGTV